MVYMADSISLAVLENLVHIFLLNPTHSDFSRLLIDVGTFVFDPRLFG